MLVERIATIEAILNYEIIENYNMFKVKYVASAFVLTFLFLYIFRIKPVYTLHGILINGAQGGTQLYPKARGLGPLR
jgi:hypothetical protein